MNELTTNVSSKRQGLVEELKNLKRKTALMQFCHGKMEEQLSNRERISSLAVTILAALAFAATTAETRSIFVFLTEEDLKRIAAVFLLSVFLLTLWKLEAHWGAKAGTHSASLDAFTTFLRRLDVILRTLDDRSDDELESLSINITKEYSDISESSPRISSKEFLYLKQQHLQIVSISRALDKDPFISLKDIRKHLSNTKAP